MVLDFIILTIAIFTSLLFLMSTIADIVSSGGFVVSEAEQKQKELNAKYRIVLSIIMSLSWTYVILLI
jgi:hypothetical protein